jgi:hypothetical protein
MHDQEAEHSERLNWPTIPRVIRERWWWLSPHCHRAWPHRWGLFDPDPQYRASRDSLSGQQLRSCPVRLSALLQNNQDREVLMLLRS